jgi:hypothetical protein
MKTTWLVVVAVFSTFLVNETAMTSSVTYFITLENELGDTITSVYISGHNKREWGEDLLQKDETIPTGRKVTIRLPHEYEYWDLKVVLANGKDFSWQDGFYLSVERLVLSNENGEILAHEK